ncbi:MAG: branched-chain amino acid ABC transporter permease [Alphaproteobacteria bacterium]|nr:branched-chain amino acid ABC transporter permease [Alphaproteobacteria bacterium]
MITSAQFFLALLEGIVGASVLALTALGLSLVFGVMRIINIAHGELVMLGAVIAYAVASFVGGSPLFGFAVAAIIAPLAVGAMAIAADFLVLRRIAYDPERTIVATMGLLFIAQQLALMTFGPDARPVEPPIYFRVQFPWFGYSGYKLIVVGASIVLVGATFLLLTRTRLGLYMRATQMDADIAQAFGVPVRRIYATVFGLGAVLAALAGVLIVPIRQAHHLMGGDPLLLSFIVVILGGLGNLRGTIWAAIFIGVSEGMISVLFSPTLSKIIATLLVALVLVVRPGGLTGKAAA